MLGSFVDYGKIFIIIIIIIIIIIVTSQLLPIYFPVTSQTSHGHKKYRVTVIQPP